MSSIETNKDVIYLTSDEENDEGEKESNFGPQTSSNILHEEDQQPYQNNTESSKSKRQRLDSLYKTSNNNRRPSGLFEAFLRPSFYGELSGIDGTAAMGNAVRTDYVQEDEPDHTSSDIIILSDESGDEGAVDVSNGKLKAEDSDEDEDLQILDAEEATKKSAFKKTSFDRQGIFNGVSGYQAPFSTMGQHMRTFDPEELYNNPAPVPHYTQDDRQEIENKHISRSTQILEENIVLRDQLVTQHQAALEEYSSCAKMAAMSLQELTELQNDLRRSVSENNQVGSDTLRDLILFKGDEYNTYRRNRDSKTADLRAISSRLSIAQLNIRNAGLALASLDSRNGISNTDLGLNRNQYYLQMLAYNNVYADSDQRHIQNLLNNIRPDEELEDGMAQTPEELSVSLLKHQRMGLSWLLRMENSASKGSLLADDMGLGKTIQALALILANKSSESGCKTTLIVTPVSLLKQWANEVKFKIKPDASLKVGIYHGLEKKNLSDFAMLGKYDIILTSYGTISSEWKKHYGNVLESANITPNQNVVPDLDAGGNMYCSPFFSKSSIFYRIILDESQNIKNKNAIASKALYCLKGIHRLCLSGTPIQNNVEELYPLLRFLRIKPYNDELKFRADIVLPIKSKSSDYDSHDRRRGMQKLRALLRAILLRRSKNSLIDGKPILTLPEKHLLTDNVAMESEELAYYNSLEKGIQKKAKTLLATQSLGATSSILTLLLRLRQACCHSLLVDLGELRVASRESAQSLKNDAWEQMYETTMQLDKRIVEEIEQSCAVGKFSEEERNEKDIFTCPVCFDVLGYEKMMLFSECGHMLCDSCASTYFDKYVLVEGPDEDRKGTCHVCSHSVKEKGLVSYEMFHKVFVEGCSREAIKKSLYGLSSDKSIPVQEGISQLLGNELNFKASAKMKKCVQIIRKILNSSDDEKIIIFSQFTSLFDLFRIELNRHNIKHLRYDGSLSLDKKDEVIKSFYQGNTRVLLLSLRAGNVGLTLTCASHVIIMDPFWNPYVEEQAMDRAHRIGQQREVFVHRLLIEGTVESRIIRLQNEKKELVSGALDENGMKSVSSLGRKELGYLFGLNSLR